MHVELADTWRKKYLGLMFRKECVRPLVFEFAHSMRVPLHMFFVRFPIDVIYLDEDNVIVEMIINFRPWRYYEPANKCKTVIELPAGWIKKYGLCVCAKFDYSQINCSVPLNLLRK